MPSQFRVKIPTQLATALVAIVAIVVVSRPAAAATVSQGCSYDGGTNNGPTLQYNGVYNSTTGTGTVIHVPHVYVIYWNWFGWDPQNEKSALQAIGGFTGSKWQNITTQYPGYTWSQTAGGGPPGSPGQAVTNPYVPNEVTFVVDDGNVGCAIAPVPLPTSNTARVPLLANEVRCIASILPAHNGIPVLNDPDAIFVVALSKGQSWPAPFCSVHLNAPDSPATSGKPPLAFIDFPYQPDFATLGPAGCTGNLAAVYLHELTEAITNTRGLGAWSQAASGSPTCDMGDMCQSGFPSATIMLADATQPRGRQQVTIPSLWSNAAQQGTGACVFARSTRGDMFGVGNDNHLYHNALVATTTVTASGWIGWGNGSSFPLQSEPTAVSWGPGRIDTIVFDSQGTPWHAYVDANSSTCTLPDSPCWDSWSWALPSGWSFTVGYGPDFTSFGPQRLDLFATGTKSGSPNHIFHMYYDNGAASVFTDLGAPPGGVASGVGAVSAGPNQFDIFVLGSDGNIWRGTAGSSNPLSLDSTFFWLATPWGKPGGTTALSGDPDVSSWGPGKVDVFVRDLAGNLWDGYSYGFVNGSTVTSSWFSWGHPSGVSFNRNPSTLALGDNRQFVAAPNQSTGAVDGIFWDFAFGPWSVVTTPNIIGGIDMSSW